MSTLNEQIERARELERAVWETLMESISDEAGELLMAYEILSVAKGLAERTLIWGERMTLPNVREGLVYALARAELVLERRQTC